MLLLPSPKNLMLGYLLGALMTSLNHGWLARGCYHKPPDVIMKAAEGCPSVAIVVIDEDTGEQAYP